MTRTRPRRAFALPMVILLSLVVTLTLAVILNRTGVSSAAVNRQIEMYRQHHRFAGMRELVDRWLVTTHGSMREQLDSDGQAFVLELPRNERIRVSITDGQGTLLDDRRGLYGPEARYTALAIDAIRGRLGDDPDPADEAQLFRKVGPAKVSLNSAPRAVVEAVVEAIVPGRDGEHLASAYLDRRDQALLTQTDIRGIATAYGAANEEMAALELMFTADPTVWLVDAVDTAGNRVVARSGGLIEIVNDQGGGAGVGIGSRTRFLTWGDLPAE